MAESITGPGLDGISGGSSEIAAVSVGVYAVDRTGPGFERAKETATVAGTEIGTAAGRTVSQNFEKEGIGTEGGHAGILGGLSRARRAFHHMILGLFAAPFVAREAFEFGKGLGERFFGRDEQADLQKKAEETQKIIEESRKRFIEKANEKLKTPAVSPVMDEEKRKRLEALKQEEDEATKLLEQKRKERAFIEGVLAKEGNQDAIRQANQALELNLLRTSAIENELANIEKRRASIITSIEQVHERLTHELEAQQKLEESIILKRTMEERRQHALRPVVLDNMTTDISQLRNLVRIGLRQRIEDPGSGQAF